MLTILFIFNLDRVLLFIEKIIGMQGESSLNHERTMSVGDNISKKFVDKQMRNNRQNVQTLKNRLKVLSSQADYNRFRSKYQTQKIQRHQRIHESALMQRKEIDERLKTMLDVSDKKQNNEKLKQQIKVKLNEAYNRLKVEKLQHRNQIKKRTERNMELLSKRRAKDLQQRKSKYNQVVKMENNIRDNLHRYNQQKQTQLKEIKQLQKKHLLRFSSEMAKQLQYLSKKQKQLIEINSQSMQSSRMIDMQYKKLYISRSRDHHMQLPQIKRKSPTHSTSTQFQ